MHILFLDESGQARTIRFSLLVGSQSGRTAGGS